MTEFVVIGSTGTGKSSLCNFILNKNIFKISDDPNSETKEILGSYGVGDSENIYAIDTPGLNDSLGKDQIIINNIVNFLRKRKNLKAVIITINFFTPRIDSSMEEFFLKIANMFPIEGFWEHVGIVFTKFIKDLIKKKENLIKIKEEKIQKTSQKIKDIISKTTKNNNSIKSSNALKTFFIDSDLNEIDNESKEEVNRMIGWIHYLESFDTQKIKEIDNKIMEKKEEIKTIVLESYFIKNYEYITYGVYKRDKTIRYNGDIYYSDYKLDTKKKEIKVHPKSLIKTKIEEKEKYLKNYAEGDYECKLKCVEQRKINFYNNGTVEYGSWEIKNNSEKLEKIYYPPSFLKIEKKTIISYIRFKGNIKFYKELLYQRNIFKKYDNSLLYKKWTLINILEKNDVFPRTLMYKIEEKKIERNITYNEKEELDYFIIFIPIYKKVKERKIHYINYSRKVLYYNDGSIEYGKWEVNNNKNNENYDNKLYIKQFEISRANKKFSLIDKYKTALESLKNFIEIFKDDDNFFLIFDNKFKYEQEKYILDNITLFYFEYQDYIEKFNENITEINMLKFKECFKKMKDIPYKSSKIFYNKILFLFNKMNEIDVNDSFLKENPNILNNKNNINNIDHISKNSNRPPSNLTGYKINSLNNLYDQFVKKRKDQLNETNNSLINNKNNITNNSLLNESLNAFTQNNKKWKDLNKNDINNKNMNRKQYYNEDNSNYNYYLKEKEIKDIYY